MNCTKWLSYISCFHLQNWEKCYIRISYTLIWVFWFCCLSILLLTGGSIVAKLRWYWKLKARKIFLCYKYITLTFSLFIFVNVELLQCEPPFWLESFPLMKLFQIQKPVSMWEIWDDICWWVKRTESKQHCNISLYSLLRCITSRRANKLNIESKCSCKRDRGTCWDIKVLPTQLCWHSLIHQCFWSVSGSISKFRGCMFFFLPVCSSVAYHWQLIFYSCLSLNR